MTLGSMISKARKDASFSIEDLAALTNLRTALLREMEENDFSHCGGDTYARGHVRNIARKLGANEDEFLRTFDEEQASVKRTMQELLVENNIMRKSKEKRKVSLKTLLLISIISLALAAVAQIVLSNTSSNEIASPTVSASPTVQNSYSTGTGVEVVVRAARATSWLFVSDAVGRTLFSGEISKGSTRKFTTDVRLDLKVGNAGGVDIQVNGKKFASIGANGAVVSVSYGVDS